jgi:hypothetical protein
MPFMLLIVEDGARRRARTAEDGAAAQARMLRFSDELEAQGVLRARDSLRSDNEGVRVTVRDGKRIVVDGPFAESKEIIGGFFLLDCATKEAAVAIASRCPAAEWGTVEVRQIGPCWEGNRS